MDKSKCEGCRDDFYNGNNDIGVKECFNLKNAKIVLKKKVHINQVPPWKQKAIKVPDCYRMSGYVFIDKDKER